MLRETARRLAGCARHGEMLARLGGDEFVLLLEEFDDPEALEVIAERLRTALAQPMTISDRELHLTVSIGISTFPADARDASTLVAHADIAMYRAKEQGRNSHSLYTPRSNLHSVARLSLESALRRVLERDELVLHYRPKIAIATGRVAGVEALLRWQHPGLGLLPPARFMDLAEETGFIVPMGEWALHAACRAARRWIDAGVATPVAVNLSARQFHHRELVTTLASALAAHDLPARFLELEITESMVMRNATHAASVMQAIRAMGVRITLDDFGTGHSSLGYLKRFPIDCLKIDRGFVADLPQDINDVAITRAIIAMAHTLGIAVVAEGVEREDQLRLLHGEGGDEYQGFLCRPALDEQALIAFLRAPDRARTMAPPEIAECHGPAWPRAARA